VDIADDDLVTHDHADLILVGLMLAAVAFMLWL
jgi:hypothetical protein